MMIEVTYTADFSTGSDLPTQLAVMAYQPLDQGETVPSALQIVSDVTSWNGTQLQRVVTFFQTPEANARMGVPMTNEKRRMSVAKMFESKLECRVRKPVVENISLLP